MSFEQVVDSIINCGIIGHGKMGHIRHSASDKSGERAKVTMVFDVVKLDDFDTKIFL